jgi:hypothetical protein
MQVKTGLNFHLSAFKALKRPAVYAVSTSSAVSPGAMPSSIMPTPIASCAPVPLIYSAFLRIIKIPSGRVYLFAGMIQRGGWRLWF